MREVFGLPRYIFSFKFRADWSFRYITQVTMLLARSDWLPRRRLAKCCRLQISKRETKWSVVLEIVSPIKLYVRTTFDLIWFKLTSAEHNFHFLSSRILPGYLEKRLLPWEGLFNLFIADFSEQRVLIGWVFFFPQARLSNVSSFFRFLVQRRTHETPAT